MSRHIVHHNPTPNVLGWSTNTAIVDSVTEDDGSADADEPPDAQLATHPISPTFRRTSVAKPKENHASLLTKALQTASEGETTDKSPARANNPPRRRPSITSDISVASTADLTSDTGLSTPARTNSPSPRLLASGFVPLSVDKHQSGARVQIVGSLPRRNVPAYPLRKDQVQAEVATTEAPKDPAVQTIEKKRCISFACTAKPKDDAAKAPAKPTTQPPPPTAAQPTQQKRTCIKFACPARPVQPTGAQQTPPQREQLVIPKAAEDSGSVSTVVSTPSTIRKARSPVSRRPSSLTPRRGPASPVASRKKKYITARSDELRREETHFHEFASDHPQQEDWIRQEATAAKTKLTIDDLLKKENDIRRLGKEAEEEAELEDEEDEEDDDAEDNGDEDDDEENGEDGVEENVADNLSGYGSDDDFSDGYNTDEDLGFADSDDDDEDDGLLLWTLTASQSVQARISSATPVFRPRSPGGLSDSSAYSKQGLRTKHSRQRSTARAMTPELPDSTDFVCGTMDEDRPLEEAYVTRLAARKQGMYRTIPQDIDPSFPTSEPEDEDDADVNRSHDSGEPLWFHGELEDLHEDRAGRTRRKGDTSPKRMRSPPPAKRYHSPPPKARGRSPRRLFDRSSPKRIKSPAPIGHPTSPAVSPTHTANGLAFKSLAARPGLTHTKSLPRGAYFPGHIKSGKRTKAWNYAAKDSVHVRGAIDIVKGLEQKRQRRKEKFHQKYCNRARKGQIPEKRTKAGEGAERMRELGLLMAGKIGQGNYVISI